MTDQVQEWASMRRRGLNITEIAEWECTTPAVIREALERAGLMDSIKRVLPSLNDERLRSVGIAAGVLPIPAQVHDDAGAPYERAQVQKLGEMG